jgi:hypothetical protein
MSRDRTILTWREKTWNERGQTVFANALVYIIGAGMFVCAILVIGECLDGVSRDNSEHDQCLKHATNGYDIKQCHE